MAQRGRPSDEGDRIQTRADLIEALTEGVVKMETFTVSPVRLTVCR